MATWMSAVLEINRGLSTSATKFRTATRDYLPFFSRLAAFPVVVLVRSGLRSVCEGKYVHCSARNHKHSLMLVELESNTSVCAETVYESRSLEEISFLTPSREQMQSRIVSNLERWKIE